MGKCDAAERRPFSTSCESALINDVLLMAWARKQHGGRVDFQFVQLATSNELMLCACNNL